MPHWHGTDKHRTATETRHPLSCSRRTKIAQHLHDSTMTLRRWKWTKTVPPPSAPHPPTKVSRLYCILYVACRTSKGPLTRAGNKKRFHHRRGTRPLSVCVCHPLQKNKGKIVCTIGPELSGTESAILNRDSSDSESCDSRVALSINIGCDSDGDSESIFRDSIVLRFDSFFGFSPGPRFWESCDSRFAILCR